MKLSVKECLQFGWTTFKSRPWIFVKAALVLVGVSFVFNIVNGVLSAGADMTDGAFALVFALPLIATTIAAVYVNVVLDYMGTTKFYLNAHDSVSSVRLKDLWAPHPFVKYVLTALLVGVICLVGFILLIIPGIIAALALGMSLYLVMDKGMGPVEAIKESMRITRGNRVRLLLLMLAIILINVLGFIALLIGLFVSVPVSVLAMVHAYRTLSGGAAPVATV